MVTEAVLLCLVPYLFGLEEMAITVSSVELLFFLGTFLIAKLRLEMPYEQLEREGDRNWNTLWQNVLTSVPDPKAWLLSYFPTCPSFEALRREDVLELVSWGMFSTTSDFIQEKDQFAVARAIKQMESVLEVEFRVRSSQEAAHSVLRPSIETLRWAHKPLLFYLFTQGIFGAIVAHRLKGNSFVRKSSGVLSYWTNANTFPSSSSPSSTPIILCHGIGGLLVYVDFILKLIPLNSPIIVLEFPAVSLNIAPTVPTLDATTSALRNILDEHGFSKAVFIGHSFGSSIVSWAVQYLPERVAGSVFIDPVVFMLHLTDILWNWTYRPVLNELSLNGLLDVVKTGTALLYKLISILK